MFTAQPGICLPQNIHAQFLGLNHTTNFNASTCRHMLAGILDLVAETAERYPQAQTACVLAVGAGFWDRLYPGDRPSHLRTFPSMEHGNHAAPHTPLDLHVHLHGPRRDLLFKLARDIFERLSPMFVVAEDVQGFRYLDSRDMIGFVDGTENPQGEDRPQVALINEGPFQGGSYLHVQRYVHNLPAWSSLAVSDQEVIIGRSKQENVEFPGAQKSAHAHTKRTSLKDDEGRSIEILRHSMPYGNTTEHGLYFVSYAADPDPFTLMLQSMIKGDEQGRYDHLLDYSRAVTGASFFAPAVGWLKQAAK